MRYLITPFFYIIFYRVFFSYWFLLREFFVFDRVSAPILIIFFIAITLQLLFCLSLIALTRRISLLNQPTHRYRTCSKQEFILFVVFWLLIVIIKFDELPLFNLAGSDRIVAILSESKMKNFIFYGTLSSLGVIFFIIGLLDDNALRRRLALFLSITTVMFFMKKSGALNWVLFYVLFNIMLFNMRLSFKFLVLVTSTLIFGIYSFFVTVGLDVLTLSHIVDKLTNLLYTSSSSWLNYLLVKDGISYAADYRETLIDCFGPLVYVFNAVFKVTLGIGVEAAIGPYVISEIFNLNNNLFGFNPTLIVEMWFVLGLYPAIFLIIPVYFFIIFAARFVIWRFYKFAHRQVNVIHLFFLYSFLTFLMNCQYDLLNATKSFIFAIGIYSAITLLKRFRFKSTHKVFG